MQKKKLKSSMFNYLIQNEKGDYILYNSYMGASKAKKILKKKKKQLEHYLSEAEIYPEEDALLNALVQAGFIVNFEVNEKANRDLLRMQKIMDNKLQLILLPTEQCNFRCKYCYESFQKPKMDAEIQKRIIKFVSKNIHNYNGMRVAWFGGEPLEAFDVIENLSQAFLKICSMSKRSYWSSIITNGYNMTLDVYKKMLQYQILNTQVTIDGIKATHDDKRVLADGSGTFDVVIHNLLDISRNITDALPRFVIRTNVTREVYENIEEYTAFYSRLFKDDKRFIFFIRPTGNWGGERVIQIEDSLMNENQFKLVYDTLYKQSQTINYDFHATFLEPAGSVCYANIQNSFVIGSDGTVYKCTCNFDAENNKIGFINDKGDMIIDENKHHQWLYVNQKSKACDNCSFSCACLSANCPAAANFSTEMRRLTCPAEKKYLKETLLLLDKNHFIEILEV